MATNHEAKAGDDDGLYPSRNSKLTSLEIAANIIDGITNGRRQDLFLLIRLYEFNTLPHDGRCRLTRQELSERLHWSLWKVDEVRRLAERLGWIEIDRVPNRSGQGANKVRVAWERIKKKNSAAQIDEKSKSKKAERRLKESETRVKESETRVKESLTPLRNKHSKEPRERPKENAHADADLKNLFFGESLTREHLRDAAFLVDSVWKTIIDRGRAPNCERGPLALVAFACEVDRTFFENPKIEDEFRVFVSVASKGHFLHRKIANCDDERARRMLRDWERRKRGSPSRQSRLPACRRGCPPDKQREGFNRNMRAFRERFGSVPCEPPG